MSSAARARLYERLGRSLGAGRSIGLVLREEKLEVAADRLASGETLERAVAGDAARFPDPVPALLGAAEASGALPEILRELARELDEQQSIESRFWRGLIQPAVLLALVIFLMPLVPAYLETSVRELEQGALRSSALVAAYLRLVVPSLLSATAVLTGVALVVLIVPPVALPIIGGLVQLLWRARMARVLALGLDAGLSVRDVIGAAARATGSSSLSKRAVDAVARIDGGAMLSRALVDARLFSSDLQREIEAGEATGTLVASFRRIDADARAALEVAIRRLGRVASILVAIAMAALVGWTAYSFLTRQATEVLKALEI